MRHVLAVFLTVSASSANSEIFLSDYPKHRGSDYFKTYLNGLGTAYEWSNAYIGNRNQDKMYCQPANLSMNVENYQRILDDEIARAKHSPGDPIEMIFLYGLINTFPCK